MTIFRFSSLFAFCLVLSGCSQERSDEHAELAQAVSDLQQSVDALSERIDAMEAEADESESSTLPTTQPQVSLKDPDHSDLDRKLVTIESDVRSIKNQLVFMR
jgi:outer membrane murein-binding lipoprotein Lpp